VTEKQLFSVLVRGLGVLVLLHGADEAWVCIARLIWTPHIDYFYPYRQDLVFMVLQFLIGAAMIRSPEIFDWLAWPRRNVSN
jgi:hypothetical protein